MLILRVEVMKIAIIGTRGIPNNYGGYEELAEYLSVGLVERGHDVTVYNNHLHSYKEKSYKGVRIQRIYSPEKLIGSAANIIYDYLSLIHAIKNKVDLVLECGYQSSAMGIPFTPRKRIKIVTNMDGLDWKRSKWSPTVQKMTLWFEKLGVKYSDSLISDNLGIKEYLFEKYGADSNYIPYGANIPDSYDESLLASFNLIKDNYHMLVARLEPENNIETILDGYQSSSEERVFIVVGNHQTKYGEHLKRKYEKDVRIIFVGGVYEKEKINCLRHYCSIYFHGHAVGGTNPSLLEAMACDAFVASFDINFNRNVLGSNAMYFKSSEDVTDLLSNYSDEPVEEFRKNNLDKITTEYTWERVVNLHESLFLSVLNNKN